MTDWLIDWCLTAKLAVFKLYGGVSVKEKHNIIPYFKYKLSFLFDKLINNYNISNYNSL